MENTELEKSFIIDNSFFPDIDQELLDFYRAKQNDIYTFLAQAFLFCSTWDEVFISIENSFGDDVLEGNTIPENTVRFVERIDSFTDALARAFKHFNDNADRAFNQLRDLPSNIQAEFITVEDYGSKDKKITLHYEKTPDATPSPMSGEFYFNLPTRHEDKVNNFVYDRVDLT